MDIKGFPIANIKAGMSNLTLKVIILAKTKALINSKGLRGFSELKIADSTGSCILSIYNWELCALLKCGDIILLRDCFAKFYLGAIRLRLKNEYSLRKIGDFCLIFNEKPDISQNYVKEETPIEIIDVNKDTYEVKKDHYKPPAFRIPKIAPHLSISTAPEILTIKETSDEHDKAAESHSKLQVCPNTEMDRAKRMEILKLKFR